MNSSARRYRRWPRRPRGRSAAVRTLRSRSTDPVRLCPTPAADTSRALQSERARFAAGVDLELRLACRSEVAMRRELGCAARVFVSHRLYRRLGFVRLGDYARERLGVSARTVQSAAWLATRLDALPAVSRAYDRSELSWAQARAICRVASAGDEERWLAIARQSTVEALERLVRQSRPARGVPADPEADSNGIDGEPAVRWRVSCPARVRALWGRALELASRMAGEPLAAWRAAEIIGAEGLSGRPSGTSMGDRALLACLRLARRKARTVAVTEGGAGTGSTEIADRGPATGSTVVAEDGSPVLEPIAGTWRDGPEPSAALTPADPFALDARLVEAMRVIQTNEPRIGRLLRVVIDLRLYRMLGYTALEDYVRERLGISVRKAWALLKVEKATSRSDDFAHAYRDGRLSWARALALLPVLDRSTAAAWLARAELVTVRRLCDEVNWVLAARDALGAHVSLAPPPVDSRLTSVVAMSCRESSLASVPAEECRELALAGALQIGARGGSPRAIARDGHEVARDTGSAAAGAVARLTVTADIDRRAASEICDAEVTFIGPASVVALLRDVLDAFARPRAPRWTALERLLQHVVQYWESTPRHHDPIFARDGWRCTVPACSTRRNLHDHHIRFRSRGGGNTRDNRTVVCAAHHLHGIHGGTIRASGTAPHAIEWQLGVRGGAAPLLAYTGDRRS